MNHDVLAPIRRTGIFFGLMGAAVLALTFGADLQQGRDHSSTTIEQARVQRDAQEAKRFAARPAPERPALQQALLSSGAATLR